MVNNWRIDANVEVAKMADLHPEIQELCRGKAVNWVSLMDDVTIFSEEGQLENEGTFGIAVVVMDRSPLGLRMLWVGCILCQPQSN